MVDKLSLCEKDWCNCSVVTIFLSKTRLKLKGQTHDQQYENMSEKKKRGIKNKLFNSVEMNIYFSRNLESTNGKASKYIKIPVVSSQNKTKQ